MASQIHREPRRRRTSRSDVARRCAAILALVLVVASGPARASGNAAQVAPAPAEPPARADWPAGSLGDPEVFLAFALVHLDPRTADRAEAVVRRLAAREFRGYMIARMKHDEALRKAPRLLAIGTGTTTRYSTEHLRWAGKGLDAEAIAAIAEGRPGTSIVVRAPAGDTGVLRRLSSLLRAASHELGAAVDDFEARVVYSPDAFREQMEGAFEGDLPVAFRHVQIHSYDRADGLIRSVTVGMSKLGLPDVVVSRHPAGNRRGVGNLINLVCQWMVEQGALEQPGTIELDLRSIRAAAVRDPNVSALGENAKPRTVLTVAEGRREEGDAENRLLELTFGGFPGTELERQIAVLVSVFGATDAYVPGVKHGAEILAASASARQRLLGLKPRWLGGRKSGEHLLVKAPFDTPSGGHEYMWIDVTAWRGTELSGVLANDPVEVPGLRAGARVSVQESAVFDYLLRRADGTEEGNETAKYLTR